MSLTQQGACLRSVARWVLWALWAAWLPGAGVASADLTWATYFGGSGAERLEDVALDAAGNIYVVGKTSSTDLPTVAPFDATLGGSSDAFVAKFDPTGSTLLYSTYLGGSRNETAHAVGLDAAGNIYVAGETDSTDFPVANAIQPASGGGDDGFLAVLDPTGASLVYSTYIGGSSRDAVGALAVAASGVAALRGETASLDFPTVNAIQPGFGGVTDAFVAVVDSNGGAFVYATYFGGSADDAPDSTGYGVALDDAGAVLTCGTTESLDLATVAAFQPLHGGGLRDGFLAKLDATGAFFEFATYWGRARGDSVRACTVDADRNVYFAGSTRSWDMPLLGELQPLKGGIYDLFLAKLDPTGNQLLFSTYWGGDLPEGAKDIEVDEAERLYVVGQTESQDFPVVDPVQDHLGGSLDAFVAKLTPSGSAFVLSTFLGGTSAENPYDVHAGLAVGPLGEIVVAGTTFSSDFPTLNALDASLGGPSDGWIARIGPGPEVELELADAGGQAVATARLQNRGSLPVDVQVKLWVDEPGPGDDQILDTGLPEVQTLAPGATVVVLSAVPLEAGLPFPGTTVGARLLNPASGRILSEILCRELPCN